MHTKEGIDVKLWDEYLIFAYLFGIADKVTKRLKRLYPNGDNLYDTNHNSDMLKVVDNFSKNVISSMENVRTVSFSSGSSSSSSRGGYSSGGGSSGGR